ncbi:UDP-3-O-acyl-N-acetylglucosamine deacetylase [Bartonella sp. HY329]|uniref:UDP-3-O-acyl-N-acetylglucosamine deacetylase n=1 Tax=unclassified Bartonella TaxID=2645622 RepID=UPI0021CAA0DC|nr:MULTISPECIES: UDP-3-O-acyl-N-acetylglucosamine deacetylase [unclassified Bartonella]UXM94614.1 UDP-3-O-acyl-N-acetylglucosamine deacetylase [Bartonella sp. HY329]UXN08937.1 UDP-3-O-acyl-N-acetylglucosamine deacetylase [Bartonella sp. HY328]
MNVFQSTIAAEISFNGIGVHSGKPSNIVLKPALVDHGIVFNRNSNDNKSIDLKASHQLAGPAQLCTTLHKDGAKVETIEHLMAAISAFEIDNLIIEADNDEMPILDGSALLFANGIKDIGIKPQDKPRQYIKIIKPVRVESPNGYAEFIPDDATVFDITIDFATPAIGKQHIEFTLECEFFRKNIAPARTFGFLKDAEILQKKGLALGSSLENSLVIGHDDEILNAEGKLFEDEFVRHKALDAIGDVALLGQPFIGRFKSMRGGHALNGAAVKALLSNQSAYEIASLL